MSGKVRDATSLVGRRAELEAIRRLLESSRLVTLTGVGGAGKTRLARRTTADLSRVFKNDVWIVELADLHDPQLLGVTVATAIGLQLQTTDWQTSVLTDYIGDRRLLLTLDNCEHLVQACATLVDDILSSCPGVRVLATSQQALGLMGEAIYSVPPLSLPYVGATVPVESLGQFESVTLFVERAAALQPGFAVTKENAEAVIALCNALDGIPLALELAAARIRVLTPQAIVERLDDRYRLLSKGYGGRVPDRQRSLEASVGGAYDLCTDQERAVWAKLTIFRGGFSLDGAEEVASGEGIDKREVLDLLASLVDKSVLLREDVGGDVRYRMLETLRQFGEARLAEEDADAVRWRHFAYFVELAHRCGSGWTGPDQVAWLQRLNAEHPNLRVALQTGVDDPVRAASAMELVADLEGFWIATGMVSEARRWLDMTLAFGSGAATQRAKALRVAAWFALVHVDIAAAARLIEQLHALVEGDAGDEVRAQALLGEGLLLSWQQQPDQGVDLIKQSWALFEDTGDLSTQVFAHVVGGMVLGFNGAAQEAKEAQEACLRLTEPRGELYMGSFALALLGVLALAAGDITGAAEVERRALLMKRDLDDQLGIALVFEFLAWIAVAGGREARAGVLMGKADNLWRRIGTVFQSVPYLSVIRAANEQLARDKVSDEAFDAALERGTAMSLEDAIGFALEDTGSAGPKSRASSKSPLTPRETEVAFLVGEGLTNQQIADRLVLSIRTAQAHVENILRKLGFTSRTSIAAWVAEHRGE